MDTQIIFGDRPAEFKLAEAILIYKSHDGQSAASVHGIHSPDGQPALKPGNPVTLAALEELVRSLGRNAGGGFIRPEILSVGLDTVVWWCPAGRRRIWFKPDKRFDETKDAETKRLLKLNGEFMHYPPLLFVARRGLSIFALVKNERPGPETRLFKAPFWNLHEGGMCEGNLKLPDNQPEQIHGFEKAFFDSAFTHNSQGGRLTVHPAGYAGFLEELSRRKTKPDAKYWSRYLLKSAYKLNGLIKSS